MVVVCGAMLMLSFSQKHKSSVNFKNVNEIDNNSPLYLNDSLFHSGDIIFRDGRGIISNAFKKFSLTDPRYSHAGIIHKENGKTFVYHIIGGHEDKNMKKEPLTEFCNHIQANAFAVYRTNLDGDKIDFFAKHYYEKNIKFDNDFNLNTDDKMYCTELIYKILTRVSGEINFLPLTTISGIKFEACDNIYLSPHLKKIYSYDYTFDTK